MKVSGGFRHDLVTRLTLPSEVLSHGQDFTFPTPQYMIMACSQRGGASKAEFEVVVEGNTIPHALQTGGEMSTMDDVRVTMEDVGGSEIVSVRNTGAHTVEIQYS